MPEAILDKQQAIQTFCTRCIGIDIADASYALAIVARVQFWPPSTLQYSRMTPFGCLTMTLCRFLVELNSNTASNSYSRSVIVPSLVHSVVKIVDGVRRKKNAPKTLAATTRAASSGEAAYKRRKYTGGLLAGREPLNRDDKLELPCIPSQSLCEPIRRCVLHQLIHNLLSCDKL